MSQLMHAHACYFIMLPHNPPVELRCINVEMALGIIIIRPQAIVREYDEWSAILTTHRRVVDFVYRIIPIPLVGIRDESLFAALGHIRMLFHVDRHTRIVIVD